MFSVFLLHHRETECNHKTYFKQQCKIINYGQVFVTKYGTEEKLFKLLEDPNKAHESSHEAVSELQNACA